MGAKFLKKARLRLGLTQPKIADELEISERFWVYRESGAKSAPVWLLRAVRDLVKHPGNTPK